MSDVPTKLLAGGDRIPVIGLGTFGSDKYSAAQVAEAVKSAIEVGYRHIDCAAVYGNEGEVGNALAVTKVAREDLWVTSKVWNDHHHRVAESCERSLKDLQLDYLDLYLVHWPFPNSHGVGVDVSSRDPHAVPYVHERFMETWGQMERLLEKGLVRNIGTSNMTIPKLTPLLNDARFKPRANQMELHPHFQQEDLFKFCVENEIQPIGYSPLGSPSRPERDRTPDDSVDTEDPVVLRIAKEQGLTPAAVCIKWAVQRGQIPIPFSVKREQYMDSLDAVRGTPLSESDMAALKGIDRNCRLIKGQVFLWPAAAGWEDLWDVDGVIAG